MKELSIFIDESGDYGDFDIHSPYYIVTLVFHDQSVDISDSIANLDKAIRLLDLPNNTIHMGPLIRREKEYRNYPRSLRIKAFRCLFSFAQKTQFSHQSFLVEMKQVNNRLEWNARLTKAIGSFVRDNLSFFLGYDAVKIYYDNGQRELTNVVVTIFTMLLNNVEFKLAFPAKYKLLQLSDLVCTLELLSIKAEAKALSKSELSFFESYRVLKKNYLRIIARKHF